VLLMAYGGPNNLDEVERYLLDVRGGRRTTPELVAEMRHRYQQIGGRSPILQLTQAQGAALAARIGRPVYIGMRHWHPYIKEAVAQALRDGVQRLVGIAMAPHYSTMSVGAYEKQLLSAARDRLELALVRDWGEHPLFLNALAEHLAQALQRFPKPRQVQVIFTAHSLPQRILAAGDPYVEQLRATATAVARRRQLEGWHFAFQSAGATKEKWLGPDAGETMERLAAEGHKEFLIHPIGFVCDHVEVLYDVDVQYQALARRLGVRLERPRSLNDDPMLIACLTDLTLRAVSERGWAGGGV
jgi:ferrochelatase